MRRPVVFILLFLAAFIALERGQAYRKPVQRDVSIYAVMGHEMLAGRSLYSDLPEIRPPAVMVSYAAAETIAGYGRRAIYLLNVAVTIIALLGIYYAASAGSGGRTGGLWAAAFWAVLSSNYGLEAGEPNTEIFINATLVWALALTLRMGREEAGFRRALVIGALFALASLYKHVAVMAPIFIAMAHIALPPGERPGRRLAVAEVAVMAAVGAGVWALLFGYFAATNRYEIFSGLITGSSLEYAANRDASFATDRPGVATILFRNITAPLRRESEFIPDVLNPLAVLAGLGGALGIFKNRRSWALLAAFAAATWVEVALPGQFFAHYYQLWLPPLIVGAGWAIGLSSGFSNRRALRWLPHAVGTSVLCVLIGSQLVWYRMDQTNDWSRIESSETVVAEPLAREINTLLLPGETFYEWGANPSLYLYSERPAPTGVLSVEFFLSGKLAPKFAEKVIADLAREQPELLVVNRRVWPERPEQNPVSNWLAERYYPLPGDPDRGPFTLYVRRGGRLESRVRQSGSG